MIGTPTTLPWYVVAAIGAAWKSARFHVASAFAFEVRSAKYLFWANSRPSCSGRYIITSISDVPALSFTLYWSLSWSSASWVISILRPLAFSNSGIAFFTFSVHTWLAIVTLTVVDPPESPPPVFALQPTVAAATKPPAAARTARRLTIDIDSSARRRPPLADDLAPSTCARPPCPHTITPQIR